MSIRDLLRGLPVLARPLPRFDPSTTPAEPDELFVAWLAEAVAAGVAEPHVMVISTAGADGLPDSRVLLLREIDARGWQFATDADSAKGRQIAGNPAAALSFYWREQGRQIRVRGRVTRLGSEVSAADFLTRSASSRAEGLAGRQSEVLDDPADLEVALVAAAQTVSTDPGMVAEGHTVYAIQPSSVEFWQGDATRRHVRLRYRRSDDAWLKDLLWP